MHELSLTEKILRLVLEQAGNHKAAKITRIKLVIGDLSGIIPACVEQYFGLIAAGTIAAGAKLEFQRSKAELYCPVCEESFEKRPADFNCPRCGSLAQLTESGRECFVESIEVD
ncbi:hydrogenase nickel incorporation protein HypA/HybF [Hydrogenispora ethanolica]|jgi:hydrogenase nickel incorporation protein HypA/HybF|uniref:Hydrogenase maturation factor HypA n=1 Tax=Hydrogenispora ethanolica TaxID=1082276 RepID=A0A4R1RM69_HYDET|nr:hydrogenase maturation nickel metallochaperone HypA [Hydrogenispora ethanolica]TCL67355.1 hydrogenase nickel incorporation protein HypA/HybF [Hydrogenispora ethanolica]